MGKVDLGMKLTCESCGARFYDLNKTPAVCPKCGASNSRPAIFKSRSRSAAAEEREDKRAAAAAAAAKTKAPEDEVEVEAAADDEDEDDEVIEDTSDLGEDDDVEVPVKSDE